jgi:hypothetical protein
MTRFIEAPATGVPSSPRRIPLSVLSELFEPCSVAHQPAHVAYRSINARSRLFSNFLRLRFALSPQRLCSSGNRRALKPAARANILEKKRDVRPAESPGHDASILRCARDQLNQKAQDLATLRRATVIPITGADEFFSDLRGKVNALEDMSTTDVLSAKVAVARMKRYLADPVQRISLHDLVTSETEKAYAVLTGPRFPVTAASLYPEDVRVLLKTYEDVLEVVLRLLICGAYWSELQHDTLLLRCFKRIADQQALVSLKRYPSLLLLYGAGIAALSRSNYRILRSLFGLKVKYDAHKPEKTVAGAIFDQAVLRHDQQKQVLGNRHTPMSDHLFEILRDPLREYLPGDIEYDQTFDWFEYLLCLCYCDAQVSRSDLQQSKAEDPNFHAPGVGRPLRLEGAL